MNINDHNTRSKLAKLYGVHYNTFYKWLKEIPELKKWLSDGKRILRPRELKIIFEEFGEPPEIEKK